MRKRQRQARVISSAVGARHFEGLEDRVLFATQTAREIYDVGNVVSNTPTTTVLTDTKSGPMANTSPSLVNLYIDYRRYRNGGGLDANYKAPSSFVGLATGSRVGVTIRGRVGLADLTDVLRGYGALIIYRTSVLNAVDAMVPIAALHSLAADPKIATVNLLGHPNPDQAGSVGNQADQGLFTDLVRNTFGLDGTGIKVGIISNSVNQVGSGIAGSVATGDLPADGIQVLSDLDPSLATGSDEGRAIAELVHDIAPGAELAFATAGVSMQVFADSIRALKAAGCNVIVDDIAYFNEPYFQPGILEQAINEFTAGGGVYLSAAGNDYDTGFESAVNFTTVNGAKLVDWDPSTAVDTRMRIQVDNDSTMILQWDNPFNGLVGNVSTDLDVYLYDANVHTRIRVSATANNLKTGIPLEQMNVPAGHYDLEIRAADSITGKPLPTRIKFILFSQAGTPGLGHLATEYVGTAGTIFGHNGGENVISTGAVPFYAAPPFDTVDTPIFNEEFSSTGTVTRVFDADGNRLPSPVTLQKPDVSAIDGGNTSFFTADPAGTIPEFPTSKDIPNDADLFPNFFGTSAAVGNLGGLVALLLEAAPHATQSQISEALKSTATPLNGSAAGSYDTQGGFGLVNAMSAIEQFVTAPTVQSITVPNNPAFGGIASAKIVFSQQISGFDVSDLTLTVNNSINLLTGLNAPTTTDGGRTWIIPNLQVITTTPGTYTLTVADSQGDIANTVGLPLTGGATKTFTILDRPGVPTPPSNVQLKVLSAISVRVRWSDNSGIDESGFLIQRSTTPDFTSNVKNFTVGQNVAVFTDTDTKIAGTKLYYRVRAFNAFSENSAFSAVASVTTPSIGEVILDNESSSGVVITGSWDVSNTVAGTFGSSYLDDLNGGKGVNSVKFTPNIQTTGDYFVYARWTKASDRATNVPVDINSASGKKTVTIDERNTGGAGWVLLGKFHFTKGTAGSMVFRTGGTNGKVIVDAVRFLPAG